MAGNVANLKPWQKGQSGNPKGRPKTKTLIEYARERLDSVVDEKTGKTLGEQKAEEWIENAIASPALWISLLERLYGKVPSSLDLTTKGESMNGDVHLQGVEHRVAALLDKLQKRMNDSK